MTTRDAADGRVEREKAPSELDTLSAAAARCVRIQAGASLALDENVYFPVDGIATLLLERDEIRFQVGFGKRGDAIGVHRLLVSEFPRISAKVLRSGTFVCVRQDRLRALLREDGQLRARLTGYAMRSSAHYLDEAARAVVLTLERRVAHWIDCCGRTLASDIIPVTHHDLAYALGVRRSGVTVALHVLEGEHLIRSMRARIEVIDGEGLAAFSRPRLA